jgi:hypothetical protein
MPFMDRTAPPPPPPNTSAPPAHSWIQSPSPSSYTGNHNLTPSLCAPPTALTRSVAQGRPPQDMRLVAVGDQAHAAHQEGLGQEVV